MTTLGRGETLLGEPLIVSSANSLEPSVSRPRAPARLSRYGRSVANCCRAFRAASEVSGAGPAMRARASRSAAESAAVIGGPARVHDGLARLVELTQADELMLVCDIYDPELRLRALDIAAAAMRA